MNDFSIVIPVYNPNLEQFEKCINSALLTKADEIIIVDDKSDFDQYDEYQKILATTKDDKRVKIIYNELRKGMFKNSIFSLSLATSNYVKKLDSDDEMIFENINKIDFSKKGNIILGGVKSNVNYFNKKCSSKMNLFNGSVIYNREIIHEAINKIKSSDEHSYFDDIYLIYYSYINNRNLESIKINMNLYYSSGASSTLPKMIFDKFDNWKVDFDWINEMIYDFTFEKDSKMIEYNLNNLYIFENLMLIKSNLPFRKHSIKNGAYWKLPIFIRKIIARTVLKK